MAPLKNDWYCQKKKVPRDKTSFSMLLEPQNYYTKERKWEAKKWYNINVWKKSADKPIQFYSPFVEKWIWVWERPLMSSYFLLSLQLYFFPQLGNRMNKNLNDEIFFWYTIFSSSTWQWESKNTDKEFINCVCGTCGLDTWRFKHTQKKGKEEKRGKMVGN